MTTLYMIGDSTMANKSPDNGNPEHGWGQLLPEFFKPGAVAVDNRAKDGRSTKSFRGEGLWDPVLKALRPGEWVVIQFGHNDQKKDKPHFYAEAATAYRGRGVWRSCLRGIWRGRSLGCRSIWRKAG
ncbi:hypothetical protein DB346_12795 [Verrucomicrobia bacterium LW23]|nr:hypothetical protein DB346_12795 [Verrucomicrobia bacterium LW23]